MKTSSSTKHQTTCRFSSPTTPVLASLELLSSLALTRLRLTFRNLRPFCVAALIACLVGLAGPQDLRGATYVWSEPAYGVFHFGTSWEGGIAPGLEDTGLLGATLTTTFNPITADFLVNTTVNSINVTSGDYRFDFGNTNLTIQISGDLVVGAKTTSVDPGLAPTARLSLDFGGADYHFGGLLKGHGLAVGGDYGYGVRPAILELKGVGTQAEFDVGCSVGGNGDGKVVISRGAQLRLSLQPSGAYVGGQVIVQDAGSRFDALGQLALNGRAGQPAELVFTNGAAGRVGYIGIVGGSQGGGVVTSDGAGSLWDVTAGIWLGRDPAHSGTLNVRNQGRVVVDSDVSVGRYGPGVLNVSDGGQVQSGFGFIGTFTNGPGTATISGYQSVWTITNGGIVLGRDANGRLDALNGGTLTLRGDMQMGYRPGVSGLVTVAGFCVDPVSHDAVASRLNVTNLITVGEGGSGILTITNQGVTRCMTGQIASGQQATGSVFISSSGLWQVDGSLFVGGSAGASGGTGFVSVLSSGRLAVGTELRLWTNGSLIVDGAAAVTIGQSATRSGSVSVGLGGVLTGSGAANGNVVLIGGTISPGNSVGTLAVNGDYFQTNGTLRIEVGGNRPGQDFDVLRVQGTAVLSGGQIEVLALNSYRPQIGEEFVFLTAASVTGSVTVTNSAGWNLALIVSNQTARLRVVPYPPLVVTNTADSGPGSLRNAITTANSQAGAGTIRFSIPGTGVQTIRPLTPLPQITDSVTIDGYTQPGAAPGQLASTNLPVLLIQVTGTNSSPPSEGLKISASSCMLRGLVINGFGQSGVTLNTGTTSNRVEGCFLGTDPTGNYPLGNGDYGLLVLSGWNVIGGSTPGAGNLVSGNRKNGIEVLSPAHDNLIQGNIVGASASGTTAVSNAWTGVMLDGAPSNTLGGTTATAGNLISGNGQNGVFLIWSGASGNLIAGNYIGTDATGTNAIPNKENGLVIRHGSTNLIGGTQPAARNLISGNSGVGISIFGLSARSNIIQGNLIGTDVGGMKALRNGSSGIVINVSASRNIVGGDVIGTRNVISGNGANGVQLADASTSSNVVQGNFIGVDITGTNALGNGGDGLVISDTPNNLVGGIQPGAGNVISGNKATAISVYGINARGTLIQGNLIGTDATGMRAIGNTYGGISVSCPGNQIGGLTPSARNVISGCGLSAIGFGHPEASNNIVLGNFVGTDITGTNALGNGEDGILLWAGSDNQIGGSAPGAANVIVASRRRGMTVYLGAQRTIIQGNSFGTDLSGTRMLGNTGPGLYISDAHNSIVGGTAPGEANKLAYNGGAGIQVGPGTNNALRANAIWSNGGLGIDLGGDGVTPNDLGDPDLGANQLQNYPVLSSATLAGSLTIQGTLNSLANKVFQLDFFASDAAAPSGYGQGQTYLGSRAVTTDTSGNATFSHATGVAVPLGKWVTATATDPVGNTSEFSRALAVAASPQFTADSLRVTNGVFSAQLAGLATGARVVIEASEDLQAWSAISTNTSIRGVVNYTDPAATNFRHRFYRALLLP